MKKIIFSKKVPDSDSKFDVIDLRGDFFHERNVNYDKNLDQLWKLNQLADDDKNFISTTGFNF